MIFVFCLPELKAQVLFFSDGLSVYKCFTFLSSSPKPSHWASFNQTWHKAFLDDFALLMGTVSHVSKMSRGPLFFIFTNLMSFEFRAGRWWNIAHLFSA